MNPSQTENLLLKRSEGKLFVTSIDPACLMTMPVAFESNLNLTMIKGKPIKISSKQASALVYNNDTNPNGTKYVFSKMIGENFAVTV